MPRTARLDAPGILHHVIIRGIERRKIFRDNKDRENFILTEGTGGMVRYFRTGINPLSARKMPIYRNLSAIYT